MSWRKRPELAQAVENKARSLGLLVCLIDSQGSPQGESGGFALLQQAVDGVIWCPLGPRLPAPLKKLNVPIVLIDRPRPGYAVVRSNYVMGGRLLAEYALRWVTGVSGCCPARKTSRAPRNCAMVS